MDISKMTIAERIHEFWTRHEVVDSSLLPDAWVMWTGKRNKETYRKYYHLSTGSLSEDLLDWINYNSNDEPLGWCRHGDKTDSKQGYGLSQANISNKLLLKAGSDSNYIYFKYDDELEVIEVSIVNIDTKRYDRKLSQEQNVRNWGRNKDFDTFFMVRGSKEKYDENGKIKTTFRAPGYQYHGTSFHSYIKQFRRIHSLLRCAKEFERFAAGTLYGACGRALNPMYVYHLEDWFNRDTIKRSKGAVGKKIDELCGKITKDLSGLNDLNTGDCDSKTYYYSSSNDIIYIDLSADKEWAVLRYLVRRNNGDLDESYRVFIHNNGKIMMARKNGPDSWTHSSNITRGCGGGRGKIINYEEMKNHRRLSYIADIVAWAKESEKLQRIISLIKFPIIEQLYKSGYETLSRLLLNDSNTLACINKVFGSVNLKEGSLYGKVGMSKAQLDYYEDNVENRKTYYSSYQHVAKIKQLLSVSNLSNIDIKTFKELYCAVNEMMSFSYSHDIKDHFTTPEILALDTTAQIKLYLKLYRMSSKTTYMSRSSNVFYILRDTISVYKKFPEDMKPEFDLTKVDGYSDMVRLHDGIVTLYNAMRSEILEAENKEKEKKMKKLDEKRKKVFEAEDNDFVIRLPLKLSEIINEGIELNHCVGGYADRHALGMCTILFLRRKSNPNKSFYTIECVGTDPKEDIRVTQIHGNSNMWLGNNPEAVPFVLRWLRDKGIKCADNIVLSTAKGYSGYGATLIEKPEI